MANTEDKTRYKFNYLKKFYDETWDEKNHTLHVGLFKNEKDSLEKAYKNATDHLIKEISDIYPITKESSVLDIGCGTGRTLIDICNKNNCRGVGVDLSDEQIKDAKNHLTKLNKDKILKGLPKIKVKFIRASGGELDKIFDKDSLFTHIISQDAILLITNKQSLFDNIYRLLSPGGVLAIADFVSEAPANSQNEKKLIYNLVNWNERISFSIYERILKGLGLSIVKSERRDDDMIRTYNKLAQKIIKFDNNKDETYRNLKERYEKIVLSVKDKKMGWAFFFAQKPKKKVALIAGNKEKSIGRFLANYLHEKGYEIWIYGRSAKKVDKHCWHERKCDISNEKSIKRLLSEIKSLDLSLMLADGGNVHFSLENLSEDNIKQCVNAKLVGSILLNKNIVLKFQKQATPIKFIWFAGNTSKKPKDLITYSMINSGLASYIVELNRHYSDILEAYYLPTGLISPSTLGDEFIKLLSPEIAKMAQHPRVLAESLQEVIDGRVKPGMMAIKKDII
ncbi:MAG: methyltransferase [uncultured bacterium]|nr:MAG: methyltransferase [uncultured bacterium]OGH90957.1 MAG: hypothetical protein A2507_05140 [Candidatus Magasanikbacteria bacterium RIFOXYD12_FULL_33_17]HAO52411.1 hypothetical protein [Candidatus Magasanikbacteria bacterium]